MRRQRTIYFNDARHYYLFIHEPPMRLEDAWAPIDEVAGTAVDTFIYGVSRGDGLFYPSERGLRFGADKEGFDMAAYWRVWENMQSLIDRGLDPLRVLVDRAHDKGMEFFASLRMGDVPGLAPEFGVASGGRGFVHQEMRDHQFAVLEELATRYPVEGVELDFAAAPGGTSFWLKPEDVAQYTQTVTEFVRRASGMVHSRPGRPGLVGARVYPTQELNDKTGLDVRTWLDEGLVDFVVPLVYAYFVLDANMPIDWLVQAAHESEVSVYAMMQPYYTDESRRFYRVTSATPAMMRAAAANLWEKGADGLYTWFMSWPLGAEERSTLSELGDPELVKGKDKHYFLRRRSEATKEHDYPAELPLSIPCADAGRVYQIPFAIADDPGDERVRSVVLKLGVTNLVSSDAFEVCLNGKSLSGEACKRKGIHSIDPYAGLWLEYHLEGLRPQKGENLLEVCLQGRSDRLEGGVTIEDVEIIVEYDTFPARPGS